MVTADPHQGRLAAARRLAGRHREGLSYLVVGGWNTVFGYAVFAALYTVLRDRLHVDVILVASYAIAVPNNYFCYRRFVFRSDAPILREFPRFSVVYVITLAANAVVLPLALEHLALTAYAIQAVYTVIVVVATYVANKYFSFGGGRRAGEPGRVRN